MSAHEQTTLPTGLVTETGTAQTGATEAGTVQTGTVQTGTEEQAVSAQNRAGGAAQEQEQGQEQPAGAVDYGSVPGLDATLDGAGVLRLRLNRPDKRNAIDDAMMVGLAAAIERAGQDEAVRVVLLTGAGGNFCGGADILARNSGDARTSGVGARPRAGSIQRRLPARAHRLMPLVMSVQTPVVCAVRGWAAGIGLALAVAADVTVAACDARFWAPFSERGFTPDSGLTWALPRRIGEVRARRMLLLGERVDGATAAEWGLVDRAVPDEDLDRTVDEVVAAFAAAPTVAVGLTKWLMYAGASTGFDDHLRNEAFGLELSSRSEDFREGLAAFREKRRPRFQGR